jgi:hypothetical protein
MAARKGVEDTPRLVTSCSEPGPPTSHRGCSCSGVAVQGLSNADFVNLPVPPPHLAPPRPAPPQPKTSLQPHLLLQLGERLWLQCCHDLYERGGATQAHVQLGVAWGRHLASPCSTAHTTPNDGPSTRDELENLLRNKPHCCTASLPMASTNTACHTSTHTRPPLQGALAAAPLLSRPSVHSLHCCLLFALTVILQKNGRVRTGYCSKISVHMCPCMPASGVWFHKLAVTVMSSSIYPSPSRSCHGPTPILSGRTGTPLPRPPPPAHLQHCCCHSLSYLPPVEPPPPPASARASPTSRPTRPVRKVSTLLTNLHSSNRCTARAGCTGCKNLGRAHRRCL